MPTIEFNSGVDVLTFAGTPDGAAGYVYDNATLESWYKLPDVNVKLNKRPNAHGTYAPDQLFTNEARVPITGRFFGFDTLAAAVARNRIAALFNDGKAIMMTVTDELGATSRVGFIVDYDPKWENDGNFSFTAELAAPDPRRYGTQQSPSNGLPTASSGLVWPLGSGSSFWDWGTPGNSGRVTFTNIGNTTTYPVFLVGAGGRLSAGFSITQVGAAQRTLIFSGSTGGGVVRLDSRTQRATINGGDVTRMLSRKEWFAVPAGASYEYQFATLGAVTGAPTMQLLASPAYL